MNIFKKFYAWFSKQKIAGKVVIMVVLLISLCCLISVPIALLSPSSPSAPSPSAIPATDQPQPVQVNSPVPTVTEIEESRCIPASNKQIEAIRLGIKGISEQNDIKTAWSVKSSDYENAWFVAAKIYGPGMEDGTGPGLWTVSGDPENPSSGAFSVDGFAKEFSDRGTGETIGLSFSMYDDGAQEALLCAGND
ncbi:MAG: hypothetical protein Q7U53_17185 [Anaerolineaceae bacterium]|nr:hypothetical protein [Anaerolineaceae bacterium]